ncbi:hypothetical protein GCK32_012260, partial [Trichostrongylus colubriformis]
ECPRSKEDSVATPFEEIDEDGEKMARDTVMTEEREDEERHLEMNDEEDDDESYWRKMVREDLRPAEIGFHHKAVCTVPDKKYIPRAQAEEVRRELWILMAEAAHEMDGEDTHAGARVTTMSF